MFKGLSICLVIPCYNEEDGLKYVLKDIPEVIDRVLIVNNNSTDNTEKVAKSLGADVVFEKRQGYGRAYKTGFENVTEDLILTGDGDNTYPFYEIFKLVKVMLDENLDFITCRRFPLMNKDAMGFRNVIGNKILTWTGNILFGLSLWDSQSGMWLFKRDILDDLALVGDSMELSEEIKISAFKHPKINAAELPIIYKRREGISKLEAWGHGFRNLKFLFQKRFGSPEPMYKRGEK